MVAKRRNVPGLIGKLFFDWENVMSVCGIGDRGWLNENDLLPDLTIYSKRSNVPLGLSGESYRSPWGSARHRLDFQLIPRKRLMTLVEFDKPTLSHETN